MSRSLNTVIASRGWVNNLIVALRGSANTWSGANVFSGAMTSSGLFTLSGGLVLSGAVTSTATIVHSGAITLSGNTTLSGNSTISGACNATGVLVVSNTNSTWSGGPINATGGATFSGALTLTYTGGTAITAGGGAFTVNGIDGQVNTTGAMVVGGNVTFSGSLVGQGAAFSKRVTRGIITLATATDAIDASLGNQVAISTSAGFTLASPSNGVDLQSLLVRVKNTAGADKTMTFAGNMRTDDASTTLTLKAGKIHYVPLLYHATDTKWDLLATPSAAGY